MDGILTGTTVRALHIRTSQRSQAAAGDLETIANDFHARGLRTYISIFPNLHTRAFTYDNEVVAVSDSGLDLFRKQRGAQRACRGGPVAVFQLSDTACSSRLEYRCPTRPRQ